VKIWNSVTLQERLVCVAEIWIALVEKRPIRSLMPTRVEHSGYHHDRWSAEAICNIIGVALLVLDVQMNLLQICGPLLIAIVLQLPLCLYELQGSMVCVDDCVLPQNVMILLSTSLHNGIHFFVISGILLDRVGQCRTVICHCMPLLSKNCPNSIVRGISLDLKWLLQVW
jgi:hypothetical protein